MIVKVPLGDTDARCDGRRESSFTHRISGCGNPTAAHSNLAVSDFVIMEFTGRLVILGGSKQKHDHAT